MTSNRYKGLEHLFKIMEENKIGLVQLKTIYEISNGEKPKGKLSILAVKKLNERNVLDNGKMTDLSHKLLKEIDLIINHKSNGNVLKLSEDILEIFPKEKLPSGKYARTNVKEIQKKMEWFLKEYKYDNETILSAARRYVEEYKENNYLYMKTCSYFIKKMDGGSSVSELATYCDNKDETKVRRGNVNVV